MITTGLQLAILGGILTGSGLAGLVWRLAPAYPHAGDALTRLASDTSRPTMPESESIDGGTLSDRLGKWAMTTLPRGSWGNPPSQELALLRIPVARFYGEKLLFAFVGLLIPPFLTIVFAAMGCGCRSYFQPVQPW